MYKNDCTFSRLNKKQVMKYELIVEFFAIFFFNYTRIKSTLVGK